MTATGRYRFRRSLLGLVRVLQAEHLTAEDELVWRDVARRDLTPERIFSVVRPSQWLAFVASDEQRRRVDRAQRRSRKKTREFEASRLS